MNAGDIGSRFVSRVTGLRFTPGLLGFEWAVSTPALWAAGQVLASAQDRLELQKDAQQRVYRSGVLGKRACGQLLVEVAGGSSLLQRCSVGGAWLGPIGPACPGGLAELPLRTAEQQWGAEVRYATRAVETPQQALALLIAAQTWAEWVDARLWPALEKESPAGAGLEEGQRTLSFDGVEDSCA